MGKILKISLIVISIMIVYAIIVNVIPVKEDIFSIEISFDNNDYQDGEVAKINTTLKNNSLSYYKATFLSTPVMTFIYEVGEQQPAVNSLAVEKYFVPLGRFRIEKTLTIDIEKVYIIHGFVSFTIRGERHIIEGKYKIENGKVITE